MKIFKRDAYLELLKWKAMNDKRELGQKQVIVIDGPRQVGKTTLAITFGKQEYKHYTYINLLDLTEGMLRVQQFRKEFTDGTKSIADRIEQFDSEFIDDVEHLVIIDEIQEDAKVFSAIRAFARTLKCDVIVSGSYLGRTYTPEFWISAGDSLTINLDVLSFEEFLAIFNKRNLYNSLDLYGNSAKEDYDEINKYFKVYRYIGGYPRVINGYIETRDVQEVDRIIQETYDRFCSESHKYLEDPESRILFDNLIDGIAINLLKEKKGLDGRSFSEDLENIISKNSSTNIGQREIRKGLNWFYKAHMLLVCDKCINCNLLDIKMMSRYYINDLGMLRYFLAKRKSDASEMLGILNELFVGKTINTFINDYFGNTKIMYATLNDGELDFILSSRTDGKVYGVEVKTGKNKGKTITDALNRKLIDYAINFKGNTYGGKQGNIITIPLALAGRFKYNLCKDVSDSFRELMPPSDIF